MNPKTVAAPQGHEADSARSPAAQAQSADGARILSTEAGAKEPLLHLRFPLWVWAVLIGLLLPSLWVWRQLVAEQRRATHLQFEALVRLEREAVAARLQHTQRLLHAVAESFDFSAPSVRDRWREMALPLQRSCPGAVGLGFARYVYDAERDAFIQGVRDEGYESFDLRPQSRRLEYAVVTLVEPFERKNLRSFGYDLLSDTQRRQAMMLARDSGRLVMSGRVSLGQETSVDQQLGVYLFAPVYRRNLPLNSVEERRVALLGFVYMPLVVRDMFDPLREASSPELFLTVHSGVEVGEQSLLYDARQMLPARQHSHVSLCQATQTLESAGQVWTLGFGSMPGFEAAQKGLFPHVAFAGMLLFDLSMVLLAALMAGLRSRVERRAARLTADLRQSEHQLQRSNAEVQASNRRLSEMSNLHQAILQNAGYALIATETEGIITLFNPAAEQILGYKAEEVVGKKTPALFHDSREVIERAALFSSELGEDIKPGFEVFVARSRRRLPNEYEWTHVRKDGTRVPVLLSVSMLSDADHKVKGFLGIAVDISERKRAEVRLNLSMRETRDLKIALDAQAIVDISDRQGRLIYVNDNFCAISRYSRGELLGQDHRIFNSGYHPREYFGEMFATLNRGEIWHGEVRNKAKDGSIFWVDTTIVPFRDERGMIYEYVAIRTDITQRRLSEQARLASEALLRQFVTHTPAAIAMLDHERRFLHVSERWVSDFSLAGLRLVDTRLEEHAGLPGEWLQAFVEVMAGSVRSGESECVLSAEGVRLRVRWEARPWLNTDHSFGGVMLFAQILERGSLASHDALKGGAGH